MAAEMITDQLGSHIDYPALCKAQEEVIENLKVAINAKDEEIREIRSQLDIYKTIVTFGSSRRSQVDSFGIPRPIDLISKFKRLAISCEQARANISRLP